MEFKCNNLSIFLHDGRQIIKNLSFLLNKRDKLAIIGEEGNGKSTILKWIVNPKLIDDYCNYSGEAIFNSNKIGYLEQSIDHLNNLNCLSYLIDSYDYDGYEKIYIIKKLFNDFNLKEDILDRDISTLSGGEKVKLQLVKIEIEDASFLVFDEPTNDLDLETLIFLEEYIKNTTKAICFVSHDVEFLKNTANMILHIEQIKRKTESIYTLKTCSYEEYLESREISFKKQNAKAYQEDKEIKEKQEVLRKFKSKIEHHMQLAVRNPSWGGLLAKKMKSIKSQEGRIKKESENKTEYASYESEINLFFESDMAEIPNGKVILSLDDIDLKLKDGKTISNINLNVKGREHLCIIGNNGIGKTTLLHLIREKLRSVPNIIVGYFPQDYQEILNYDDNVIDYLCGNDLSLEKKAKVMTYLSAANFLESELYYKIKDYSGGQKAKIILIKLILDKANVIILDEPTRNLSSLSSPVMANILSEFKGTIISVSHDRNFIKNVCDKVYLLDEDGLSLVNTNEEF